MFKAEIYLCHKNNFNFDKFYFLIHDFKTKMGINLELLRGEGSELRYTFTNDSEKIYITFDSKYVSLSLDLEVEGSLESFNEYYKEIEKIIKANFYSKKESSK